MKTLAAYFLMKLTLATMFTGVDCWSDNPLDCRYNQMLTLTEGVVPGTQGDVIALGQDPTLAAAHNKLEEMRRHSQHTCNLSTSSGKDLNASSTDTQTCDQRITILRMEIDELLQELEQPKSSNKQ